jgi:Uma2 family endonuclease
MYDARGFSAMPPDATKRLFTTDEFRRMAEAGIFGENDRVELIGGEIIALTPIGPRHANCVRRLIALLAARVGTSAIVDAQNPVVLDDYSEPQPDVVLLKPQSDFYKHSHPGPRDVLLVIEVADSSADYDRAIKVPQYARAGIPEVWVVDLPQQVVEVYRQPCGHQYGEHVAVGPADRLRLPIGSDQSLGVDDIFG